MPRRKTSLTAAVASSDILTTFASPDQRAQLPENDPRIFDYINRELGDIRVHGTCSNLCHFKRAKFLEGRLPMASPSVSVTQVRQLNG